MARPRNISDERILEVAREVFLDQGAQVTTREIAERLGISQAVLFQRFGTKENLLIAALAPPRAPRWAALTQPGPDSREIPRQLLELARAISANLREVIPCVAVLKAAGIDMHQLWQGNHENAPPFRAQRLLTEWLTKAQESGRLSDRVSPRAVATAFAGALQARPFLAHVAGLDLPPVEADPYLEELVEILWRGLAPEEAR